MKKLLMLFIFSFSLCFSDGTNGNYYVINVPTGYTNSNPRAHIRIHAFDESWGNSYQITAYVSANWANLPFYIPLRGPYDLSSYSASGASRFVSVEVLSYDNWSPPETNSPLNASNIIFRVAATGNNPFSFECDIDGVWYDANGNIIETVSLAEGCPAGDDWNLLDDRFSPPEGADSFRVRMKPSASVSGSAASLVLDDSGYIDSRFLDLDYNWSVLSSDGGEILYQSPDYNDSDFRTVVVSSSGFGSSDRVSSNPVNVSVSSSSGSAGSIGAVIASPEVADSAAGVSAGLDLSGLIGAVNDVNDSVNNQGQGINDKLEEVNEALQEIVAGDDSAVDLGIEFPSQHDFYGSEKISEFAGIFDSSSSLFDNLRAVFDGKSIGFGSVSSVNLPFMSETFQLSLEYDILSKFRLAVLALFSLRTASSLLKMFSRFVDSVL